MRRKIWNHTQKTNRTKSLSRWQQILLPTISSVKEHHQFLNLSIFSCLKPTLFQLAPQNRSSFCNSTFKIRTHHQGGNLAINQVIPINRQPLLIRPLEILPMIQLKLSPLRTGNLPCRHPEKT